MAMRRVDAQQLPLDLGHRAGQSRDDLIVTAANAEAVAYIERWPRWPAPVTILAGPAGAGKSHLAEIWRGNADASALSPRLLSKDAPASGAPVLIDMVDDGELDQNGLFHVINQVRESAASLLLVSRSFPGAWGVTLPDLASRLRAATLVEIHEPDDALLQGVIAKLFSDRQLDVDGHVIQFIARRIDRSLFAAGDVVARLDAAALERKTRITRALAAQVVTAFDAGQGELIV